jgi:hypothetical protein
VSESSEPVDPLVNLQEQIDDLRNKIGTCRTTVWVLIVLLMLTAISSWWASQHFANSVRKEQRVSEAAHLVTEGDLNRQEIRSCNASNVNRTYMVTRFGAIRTFMLSAAATREASGRAKLRRGVPGYSIDFQAARAYRSLVKPFKPIPLRHCRTEAVKHAAQRKRALPKKP